MTTGDTPTNRRGIWALAAIVVAGAAIRLANHAMILGGTEIYFPDNDPYYHTRRILAIMADYPSVTYFDPMMNYPFGAPIIWPPLFDFLAATLCLALGVGADNPRMAQIILALISPVIGGLTALAVYALAKETVGLRYALPAAAIFVLFPAHIWYSKLGFVDHHAAVTLAQTAMFALFMRLHGLPAKGFSWDRRLTLAAGAASMAGGVLIWHGFIFFIAILDIFLLAVLISERNRAQSAIPRICWMTHIPAAMMILPFAMKTAAVTGRPMTAISLSWFHVGAASAMGVIGAAAGLARRYPAIQRGARVRLGLAAMAALLMAVTAAYSGAVAEGIGWVMTSDKFMASVLESQSFFIDGGGFSLAGPFLMLTGLFPMALLGAGAMASGRIKDGAFNPRILFLALLTMALFIMLAKQRRFGPDFGPAQAVVLAWLAVAARDAIEKRINAKGSPIVALGLAAAILLSCAPFHWRYTVTPAVWPERLTAADERYLRKNQFLYRLRDMLKVSGQAGGGAMSFWDMGHKILYITGLGVVSNNFGLHIGRDSYRDWAAFFLADDEKAAEAILEKRNIRFVIADFDLAALNSAALYLGRDPGEYYWRGGPAAEFRAKFFRTMFCRFTLPSGEMSAPGLDGFRLILDSQMDGKAGYPTAWERVAGARLALRGEPGGGALISYEFVSPAGRRRVYLNSIKLDAKGEGEARVPYSSERPDLGHTARYRVIQGSAILELAVGEKDVILGNTIPVALGKRKAGG